MLNAVRLAQMTPEVIQAWRELERVKKSNYITPTDLYVMLPYAWLWSLL